MLAVEHASQRLLRRGRGAGVAGYLRKGSSVGVITRAFEVVAAGREFVDPAFGSELSQDTHVAISEREREILQLAAGRLNNPEIAAELTIGEETVKTHLKRAFTKLGANGRTAAVATALRSQLID